MTRRRLCVLWGASLVVAVGLAAGLTWHTARAGSAGGAERSQRYEIGLFGDMPYGDAGRTQYPNVLADMNRADLAFSAFDGDIKNGSEPCYADVDGSAQAAGKPDVYLYARDLFNQLSRPVVVVPGDNEWTDCDRPSIAGPAFDAVQRLQYERQVFDRSQRSLGQHTLKLTRQSADYPENVRWTYGTVTYIGLNVPGSTNDFIYDGDTGDGPQAEANAEYSARNAANLAWIRDSFAAAVASHAGAIMIVLQADMFGEGAAEPATTSNPNDHFADTKAALARATVAFGKPVVLVNGDGHFFVVDKPLADDAGNVIENFTRVMTFGNTLNHWVSAEVDTGNPQVFTFEQHIVAANVPTYTFN